MAAGSYSRARRRRWWLTAPRSPASTSRPMSAAELHCATAVHVRDDDLVAVSADRRLLEAWATLGLDTFDVNAETSGCISGPVPGGPPASDRSPSVSLPRLSD